MSKCEHTDVSAFEIKDIPIRSMVFIKVMPDDPAEADEFYRTLNVGDVLTFRYVYTTQVTITHRIISITEKETGGFVIELTGDNKTSEDGQLIQLIDTSIPNNTNYVIGKVTGQTKLFGVVMSFLMQPIGIIFLIILPCAVIILIEILKIVKMLSEDKKKQEQENGFAEERTKEAIETAKAQEEERYNSLLAIEKQRYIDGAISLGEYQAATELAELEHLHKMTQIFEIGSAEYLQANARYQDRLIADQQKRQREAETAEKAHQQELARLKKEYFGNSPAENRALYDADIANLKIVYDAEILAAGNNAAEKLRIDEAYEQAKLALQKKYGLLSEEENKNFILRSAEWLNSDGGEAITGSVDTLLSGMSAIFSGLSSLIQAELEIQTAAIESRYDKEISMAEGNTYKVKKLEEQKQKEIAKLKNEANKKMFAMQVMQAVAQTAQNALSAFGSAAAVPIVGYILAPIAAAMAIAAGAIQIATIKQQQKASETQGYMQGGFTKPGKPDEVAGVVHAGEWVASQKLLASPVARPMIEALDKAQRTNTISSLRAGDVSRSITAPMVAARQQSEVRVIVERSEQEQKPDTELSSTIRKLNERLDEPFVTINTVTGDYGIKQAQDEYDKLIRNKTPKSRR
jgi:hypothetical protein